MIILHVTYIVKQGTAQEFINELEKDAAPKVRAENGNICYDYYFSSADAGKILLVEKWQDETSLSLHMETSQMAEIRKIKEKYVENTILEKYIVQ